MPLCIYNIKKSLSIIYTEENPSQGVPPRQFDDVQNLFRREGKFSALASLTKTEGLHVRPPLTLTQTGTECPTLSAKTKRNNEMKLTKGTLPQAPLRGDGEGESRGRRVSRSLES